MTHFSEISILPPLNNQIKNRNQNLPELQSLTPSEHIFGSAQACAYATHAFSENSFIEIVKAL